jgi:hypothetical protein
MKPPKNRKMRMPGKGKPLPPLTQLKQRPLTDREWAYALQSKMSSEDARGEIREKLGISLGSDTSYSEFLSWHAAQLRLERNNNTIEQFEEFYRKKNPAASREEIRDSGIAYFLAASIAEDDKAGFNAIANLDLREKEGNTRAAFEEKKISIAERRVAVLEKKASQADQAKGVLEGNLTPEQKQARMREIFGI